MLLEINNAEVLTAQPSLANIEGRADYYGGIILQSNEFTNYPSLVGFYCIVLSEDVGFESLILNHKANSNEIFLSESGESNLNNARFALIEKTFKPFWLRAISKIENDLKNKGYCLEGFTNPEQFKELVLLKTLELINLSKRNGAGDDDVYNANYNTFKEVYETELSAIKADYDPSCETNITTSLGIIRVKR